MSELEQRFAELPRGRQLVLDCALGERSGRAGRWWLLRPGALQDRLLLIGTRR